MRETTVTNEISVAGQSFTILKKLGEGGFSRVYEALGPDKKVRALKMINIVGMKGEINEDEMKEVSLLKDLCKVSQIASLVCNEVKRSQEGVLMIVVMEKGETSLSHVLRKIKVLSIPTLLHFWESILECIVALNAR